MSTALCPRLVALDPSVCTTASCKASHTHEPAFCDPCKAVHAAVHAGIHVASIGHRLRVDGPIAPVRCVVCAPLPGPPPAQFLFIGPEHYAAHARTSAHRAKLAQFPPAPVRTKAANGLGLGRPGSGSFHSYTRSTSGGNPYAAGAAPSPPGSRNVTPTPGTSRPGSSMSFSTGQGFSDPPPGPPPVALEPTEYVICALCHTVLPVPLSDVWPVAGSKRNVSGGSDLTIRGAQDDDHDDVGSVVTTTENDTEVRKSLVLANHMSTDNEHARRVKFPKFRAAYEKRIAKERRDAGLDDEEERPPAVGFLTHSPDQVSLSSLSSSPSVDVQGLDDPPSRGGSGGGGLFFHQHHRHRRTRSVDSSGPADPPEPRFKFQHDDEFVMQRQRSRSKYETSSNGSSERVPIRVKTQPQHGGIEPPAYVREHNLPITIPDHLLPYLSPITPSTVAPDPQEELERYGREPTSEYLQALPIRALSTPIRTTFMLQPDPEEPSEPATTPSPPPERLLTIPEQPTPAESITSSPRSKAYEPSPSPPPRLAFDDLGRVIKLGSLGWERQTGPMYDDFGLGERAGGVPQLPPIGGSVSSPATPIAPSFGSRSVSVPIPVSKPAPAPVPAPKPAPVSASKSSAPKPLPIPDSDSSDSEPEPAQVRKAEEKSVVSGSVGTVQVKRYTLNRDDTMREPVREGLTASGRAGTMPGRSSTGRESGYGRSSNEFGGRSSTLGPGRSSLGLTTTATRPVAPRNSTGEWAVLGSGAGGRGFDEFGARVGVGAGGAGSRSLGTRPAGTSAGTQPWLGSGSQNGSRPGSRVRMVRSPEELSSQGSESKPSPPYFNFRTSRLPEDDFRTSRLPEDGSESSASEASQLIRGFDSPPLDLNLGTPEMLSPRPRSNWSVSGRGDDERASSPEKTPEKNPTLKHASRPSQSPAASAGSPSAKPIPKPGPSRQQFASPTPSRPFSPTLAWNGLTPASPLSTSRSPSLSSSTGGEIAGEPKSFDGDAFLDDIGFGIARALAITGEGPSGGGSGRVSARTPPPRVDMLPEAPAPPPTTRTPPPKTHTPSPAKTDTPPPIMRSPTPPAARTPTSPPTTRPAPTASSPAVRAMRPNPSLPAMRPPRMSSPLARLSTAPSARPISPAPRTGVSDYSGVGRTRRRVRPMGTSVVGGGDDEEPGDTESVVGWDYEESVVGGGESVVGGGGQSVAGGRGSTVSGREQSVVGGRSGRGASVVGSVVGGREEFAVGWGRLESAVGVRDESVVGGKRASVVSGRTRSVVSGRQESVGGKGTSVAQGGSGKTDVGSSKRDSILSSLPAGLVAMASSDEEDSIISPIQPKSTVSKARTTAATTRGESTETPVDEFGSMRPQASSVVGSTASATALRRRVRGQSVLSTSESEAPSSVVSPLSPRLISVLQASGMHVDPERGPTSDELDAVIGRMAGMDIAAQEVQELPMTIERVDTDSGITSPIVPPGAPSDAGSLFSRVVSPKLAPAKLRLGAVRMSTTSTPAKSTTPAQNTPSRVVHPQLRPNSSLSAAARVPAPASVGSAQPPAPEVRPESLFSSGTNLRRSADPTQMPMPRGRSVFSRGPRSVTSAVSGASQEPTGLMSRLQAAGSRPKKLMATRITNSTAQKGKGKAPASASAPSDDFDGGLTSSEEESGDDEDEDSDTKTAAGEDDGLDHLTESVDEAGSLQPQESPIVERPAERVTFPHVMPSEPIDQSLSVSPQLMPSADPAVIESLEREMMPDEVLSLNPVICDACYAPMPLAKWTEHISKSGHRRNAARYSQLIMEQSTHGTPTPPLNDARERWAEATRIQPRRAHPSEYAFCDVCAVFLLRGDVEHFQGKKHYRCVRAAALNDADELESVRGSVSDEEDGPSARAFRGAAAATGSLGQQAFQGAGAAEQVTWNGA